MSDDTIIFRATHRRGTEEKQLTYHLIPADNRGNVFEESSETIAVAFDYGEPCTPTIGVLHNENYNFTLSYLKDRSCDELSVCVRDETGAIVGATANGDKLRPTPNNDMYKTEPWMIALVHILTRRGPEQMEIITAAGVESVPGNIALLSVIGVPPALRGFKDGENMSVGSRLVQIFEMQCRKKGYKAMTIFCSNPGSMKAVINNGWHYEPKLVWPYSEDPRTAHIKFGEAGVPGVGDGVLSALKIL